MGRQDAPLPRYDQGPFPTMSPLKRQGTNASDDGREQKRACSNPVITNHVGDEQATWFQISTAPSTQAQTVVPKRCIHKIVTACNLPQATCCACLDARLDGLNFMYSLNEWGFSECRWQYYCFGCQGATPCWFSMRAELTCDQNTGICRTT